MKPLVDSQDPLYEHNPDLGNGCIAKPELAKKVGFTVDHVVTAARSPMDRAQSQTVAFGQID